MMSLGGASKNWGNSYTLDAWGNLTNKDVTKCSAESLSEAVGVDNRFTGSNRYDAAGNMTQYSAYTYDAESRLKTGGGATYTYDGDGSRVAKSGSSSMLYWTGSGTDALAESTGSTLTAEYVFFAGKRVARVDNPGPSEPAPEYYISDHLGSATAIATAAGALQRETMYFPYGGERWLTGTDPNHYKFTGKERDSETGLDYFGARYYGSSMGRFTVPDPAQNSAEFRDPQTWNRYAYVTNNPLKYDDPTGKARNPITNREGLNPRPANQIGRINETGRNQHKGEYGMVRTISTPNDKAHRGVDILAPSGSPVHAPQNGTVVRMYGSAKDTKSFGLTIEMKTETGEKVLFSHLSATATGLAPGSSVEAGQIIAGSGTSGNAYDVPESEQHLHVQVYDKNGREMNPVDYFNDPNTKPNLLDKNPNPPANTCRADRCEHNPPPAKD